MIPSFSETSQPLADYSGLSILKRAAIHPYWVRYVSWELVSYLYLTIAITQKGSECLIYQYVEPYYISYYQGTSLEANEVQQ